jgi:hypothetical protein
MRDSTWHLGIDAGQVWRCRRSSEWSQTVLGVASSFLGSPPRLERRGGSCAAPVGLGCASFAGAAAALCRRCCAGTITRGPRRSGRWTAAALLGWGHRTARLRSRQQRENGDGPRFYEGGKAAPRKTWSVPYFSIFCRATGRVGAALRDPSDGSLYILTVERADPDAR